MSQDRVYRPILVGSICVFTSGVIINIIFIINYHKQVKMIDKQFQRWRKQKWFISNFYLFLAGLLSLRMYRLIYCRLYRLDIMSVKVNRPKQFLRPIFIFTGIKFIVFNIPLMIVDFVGLA